ncbi:MAG: hypothetical protein JWN14_151 [Chthonomonadales bacterium]|nr:hypothetical protein [Chthonomonadales bacterium]
MSAETARTFTLYGAKDQAGRIYLTDRREALPADAGEVKEFQIASDKVEWAIMQVQVEEIRQIPVTIHIGDYTYATPPQPNPSLTPSQPERARA